MKIVTSALSLVILLSGLSLAVLPGCTTVYDQNQNQNPNQVQKQITPIFTSQNHALSRAGVKLHLDSTKVAGTNPDRNILLIHGVTYSSHEFHINYQDYSLVEFLATAGWRVWRLDIAGFGQSGAVANGLLPNSDYAALDINAAVEHIVALTGEDKIDVLGWSWGTVTVSRFATSHPEHIRKIVLYAPILSGVGSCGEITPFHHNSWEHAASDFQLTSDGAIDYNVTDPVVVEMFCSSSWHYDGEQSPNGGRQDICVKPSQKLMDLSRLQSPTLVICGSQDPYLNYDLVGTVLQDLPSGSKLEVIDGASHVAYIEKPYYRDFQNRLLDFLKK